eukprot:scaffold74274_cov51-Phaeocystis_antarctica.AAC.1
MHLARVPCCVLICAKDCSKPVAYRVRELFLFRENKGACIARRSHLARCPGVLYTQNTSVVCAPPPGGVLPVACPPPHWAGGRPRAPGLTGALLTGIVAETISNRDTPTRDDPTPGPHISCTRVRALVLERSKRSLVRHNPKQWFGQRRSSPARGVACTAAVLAADAVAAAASAGAASPTGSAASAASGASYLGASGASGAAVPGAAVPGASGASGAAATAVPESTQSRGLLGRAGGQT